MKERAAVWTQHHLHVCFPRTFLSQQKMNIDDNLRRRSFPWTRWSRAWTLALCHDHRCRGGAKPWKEWSTHGVSTDVEKPPVSLGKWSVMESVPCVFLTGVRRFHFLFKTLRLRRASRIYFSGASKSKGSMVLRCVCHWIRAFFCSAMFWTCFLWHGLFIFITLW